MKKEILTEQLAKVNGSTFIGIDTESIVKLKGGKKNPYQGRMTKVTEGANCMIFCNNSGSAYESMVKRRMEDEGKDSSTFELKPRAWGTRVGNTALIEHKDKDYLEVFFMSPGKTKYFLDGEIVDPETIEGFETKKSPSDDTSQGGIENKVVIRTFALDSITGIRIFGEELS